MSFGARLRGLYQWYRALRALNRILATMSVAVLFLSACGVASAEPAGPGGSARAGLELVNQADHSVWFLQTRPCGSSSWSGDLIGNSIVGVSSSRTFNVAPGCRDVRLRSSATLKGTFVWDSVDFHPGQTDTLVLEKWTFAR